MKTARKIKLLGVLVIAVFLVQNASVAIAEYLPHSSHYQGRSYFNSGTLSGRIDFAVYDTHTYPDELVGADGRDEDIPWWDEVNPDRFLYIYAYQVFVDDTSSNIIDYFAILGLGEGSIVKDPHTNKWPIGSMDDLITADATAPDEDPYFASSSEYGKMAVWEFANGFLYAGDHSYFLVLGSNHDWTAGRYTFEKTLADEVPLPNPEPTSITLFGIMGAMTIIRTRKKSRKTQ